MSITIDGDLGISGVDGTAASPAIRGNDSNTGISYGTDIVTINTGGVARVTTDASGNVGVGTSTPSQRLSIASSTNDDGLRITNTSTASTTAKTTRVTFFGTDTGGTQKEAANIYVIPDGVNYLGANMAFFTRQSDAMYERMRIDASGNLLIGTTNLDPTANRVNGTRITPSGAIYSRSNTAWDMGRDVTSGVNVSFYTDNGSARVTAGNISSNGGTTTYSTSSDYRMKENVQSMSGALNKVLSLNPVTYTWKPEFAGTNQNGQGFIAHELQAVVPDCVTGEKDAVDAEGKPQYQGVDTSFLVATLVAAIQELKAEFDSYKAAHP